MKLNIYTISHPLTKILSHEIQNKNTADKIKYYSMNQLGQLLIYETIRDWMKIHKLKIKKINTIKEITIQDPNESYIIMTSIDTDLAFIEKAKYILPNSIISLINFNNNIDLDTRLKDSNLSWIPKKITQLTKIIIISYNIHINNFIKLMDYLINIKQIDIIQIRLMCIICESKKLITISKKYPRLRIYTTQILES